MSVISLPYSLFFFFNALPTTELYPLSLHDALPIWRRLRGEPGGRGHPGVPAVALAHRESHGRSEEHTSELQSRGHLVCRLLLEKKKKHSSPLSYTHMTGCEEKIEQATAKQRCTAYT